MSLNVKLLNKVKEHILAEPKRLRMEDWIVIKDKISAAQLADNMIDFADCGTVGCIAGWTVMLGDPNFIKNSELCCSNGRVGQISEKAEALLIIDDGAENNLFLHHSLYWLFHMSHWETKYWRPFYMADKPVQAKIVAAVIDDFIKKYGTKKIKKSKGA